MKTLLRLPLLTLALILTSIQCNERFPDPEVWITDNNFLNALIEVGIDSNGDGLITYSEVRGITYLDVSGKNIHEMSNLDAFWNLDTLKCGSLGPNERNYLETLDLTYNDEINYLDCSNNLIDNLELPYNSGLSWLDCSGNQLSDFDPYYSTRLTYLNCESNLLANLNIYWNHITVLKCGNNKITKLDLSNNSSIEQLGLGDMPSLQEVCVWTVPFPPDGVNVNTTGSPSVYFTTECSE